MYIYRVVFIFLLFQLKEFENINTPVAVWPPMHISWF